jgi:TPR repeat protein
VDSISIGVGSMAHLGGFISGFVLFVIFYSRRPNNLIVCRQTVLAVSAVLLFGTIVFGTYFASYRPKPTSFDEASTYGTVSLAAHQWDRSLYWYRRAALLGTEKNQFDLGYWLAGYEGYESETAGWFAMAALKGHPHAATFLADKMMCGLGIPSDKAKALYWYRKGAHQNEYAQTALGQFYLNGWGVKPDGALAYYWLTRANIKKPKPVEICKNYQLNVEQALLKAQAKLTVTQRKQIYTRLMEEGHMPFHVKPPNG